MDSRFITYPSTVEREDNHTVVLIDATDDEINDIGEFLTQSVKNFDVYIYQSDLYDLEWLNSIGKTANDYLINDNSEVTITPDSIRYGVGLELDKPLDYFKKLDKEFNIIV